MVAIVEAPCAQRLGEFDVEAYEEELRGEMEGETVQGDRR